MVTSTRLLKSRNRKKPRKARQKTGLILKIPINRLGPDEFNSLIEHHKLYTQTLITYFRDPDKLRNTIPNDGFDNYSLWDLQRYIHIWEIQTGKGNKYYVVAPTKNEAIEASRIPTYDIAFIIRHNRNGKAILMKNIKGDIMSYKVTDKLNTNNRGQVSWKNQDKVYLSKNLAYRDDFVKKIVAGATKSKDHKKMYIDADGRMFVLKMTNDYIKQNPTTYKKGNFFVYRDQHLKLKSKNGYYIFVVFKTPSGYDKMTLDARAFFVREHMECLCWQNVQSKAVDNGTVEEVYDV